MENVTQSYHEEKICLIEDIFKQGMLIDEGLKPFPKDFTQAVRENWRKDGRKRINAHTFDLLYACTNRYLIKLQTILQPHVERKTQERMQSLDK